MTVLCSLGLQKGSGLCSNDVSYRLPIVSIQNMSIFMVVSDMLRIKPGQIPTASRISTAMPRLIVAVVMGMASKLVIIK